MFVEGGLWAAFLIKNHMAIELTPKEKELLNLDILLYFDYLYDIPKTRDLDNEIYYPAYYSDKRYNLVWGGRGSGKSFDIEGKLPIVLTSCLPFCRVMMIRQVYASIEGSQFQEIKDYIEKWDLSSEYKINTRPMRITHKRTGNFIAFAGMDKPDSIKSVKDITHAIFGECFQIKDGEGFDTVDKSIRTPMIDQTKLYITFNPDNKNHWLFEKFFNADTEQDYKFYRNNMLSINTTHLDNKFIPYAFRQLIEKDKTANPGRYKVDGLGQWGDLQTLSPYYVNFDADKQVKQGLKKSRYNRTKDLHIMFDFNVFPYISLLVKQVYYNDLTNELEVCTIEEICLNEKQHGIDKVGKIDETVRVFLKRYSEHLGNVYVYGDRSGHNKKTNSVSDYATVFAMLRPTPREKFSKVRDDEGREMLINSYPDYTNLGCKFKAIDLTNKSGNPRHDVRKLLFARMYGGVFNVLPLNRKAGTINAAGHKRPLSEKYGNKKVVHLIDSECRFLIQDLISVQQTETGTKDERNKNLTHTSDASDYFFCMYFDAEYKSIEEELKR